MSEEVEKPAEILPAKSEDKLEIEKEEKQQVEENHQDGENGEKKENEKPDEDSKKDEDKKKEDGKEEKSESDKKDNKSVDEKESKDDDKKKDDEKKKDDSSDENKEEKSEKDEKEKEKKEEETASGSSSSSTEKKKFKLPTLKTPKMPDILRSKSKDRKKKKNEEEDKEEEEDSEKKKEEKESSDNKEKEEKSDSDDKKDDEAKKEDDGEEKKDEEKKDDGKKAKKSRERSTSNNPLSKLSKLMKKDNSKSEPSKKSDDDKKTSDDDKKESDDKKDEDKKDEEEKKDITKDDDDDKKEEKEKKDDDSKNEEDDSKKSAPAPGFFASLKESLFSRKGSGKDDAESGEASDEKEKLLDKDDEKKTDEENKKETDDDKKEDGDDENKDEDNKKTEEKKDDNDQDGAKKEEKKDESKEDKKKESSTSGGGFFSNLKSHIPSIFPRRTDRVNDIEANEARELLNKDEKKKNDESCELEEIKIDEKDPDTASTSSKKSKKSSKSETAIQVENDDEEDEDKTGGVVIVENDCYHTLLRRWAELSDDVKFAFYFIVLILLFIICIFGAVMAALGGVTSNNIRITPDGKYIETITHCGPIQGRVDGPDMFSFTGVPYSMPALNENRFNQAKLPLSLYDCYRSTYIAHDDKKNDTVYEKTGAYAASKNHCWRKYRDGDVDGSEDCLKLDIFTSNVVYDQLYPVVVYLDGKDYHNAKQKPLVPDSALAAKQKVVFVNVHYRRDVLGFLSLKQMTDKSKYPETSGNYGLGDVITALKWIELNIHHFGGHPKRITLLGREQGATMALALTASPKAKGLFQNLWVSNGSPVLDFPDLRTVNLQNAEITKALRCGPKYPKCVTSVEARDIVKSAPEKWYENKAPDLPLKGEEPRRHSWIIKDSYYLFKNPIDYWKKHRLDNNIRIVMGGTAQGEVTPEDYSMLDWNNTETFMAHVEKRLGSFNVSLPKKAVDAYNKTELLNDNWGIFASMLSDIRTICPLQDLANTVSNNFVSDVYFYVTDRKRSTSKMGRIADKDADIAAIFNKFDTKEDKTSTYNASHKKTIPLDSFYTRNMHKMFYTFVKEGYMPENKDLTLGIYILGNKIRTLKEYPNCDFWKSQYNIVPKFASSF